MADWSAEQYLKFEDERTRPPRDLLAQVPLTEARRIVDIGCGPGNSTELLVKRWPNATVIGIDTSSAMLREARQRLPNQTFIEANVAHWVPPDGTDLLFANAVFQWVPGHLKHLQRLLGRLPEGGVLAAQIPDSLEEPAHLLMREVAREGPWSKQLQEKGGLAADATAIVEWVKGTGLRPFMEMLETAERKQFLTEYTARVAAAYPPQADGKVLFRFPPNFDGGGEMRGGHARDGCPGLRTISPFRRATS